MSAARLVVRLLTSLVMSLLGLVLAVPTAVALAEPPSPANGHRLISVQAAPSRAAAERGQPSTWDAVLSAARGASARPDGGQSNTIYDDPALFSSADNATAHIARVQAAWASNLMGPLSSLHRTTVAANGGIRALPSGPKITAQWGADTYRHGGLMSTIEHINYRHAYNSGFQGVSRYAQGTSARDIKGYVDYVLRNGTVTDRGMIGNVGRTIGYDRAGNPVSGLEIIVRDGMIKTAFPVGVP